MLGYFFLTVNCPTSKNPKAADTYEVSSSQTTCCNFYILHSYWLGYFAETVKKNFCVNRSFTLIMDISNIFGNINTWHIIFEFLL